MTGKLWGKSPEQIAAISNENRRAYLNQLDDAMKHSESKASIVITEPYMTSKFSTPTERKYPKWVRLVLALLCSALVIGVAMAIWRWSV